jgi:hypothetical protein
MLLNLIALVGKVKFGLKDLVEIFVRHLASLL